MRRCHDEGIMLKTETMQTREINLLRGMSYVFSVLSYLQDEPLCQNCQSFAGVADAAKENFIAIEKAVNKNRELPQKISKLLTNIYVVLADLKISENPLRQKISGNCHMPSGMCLAKSAQGFYETLEKTMHEMKKSPGNGQ
jgi:hypothetical protein